MFQFCIVANSNNDGIYHAHSHELFKIGKNLIMELLLPTNFDK